MEPTKVYKKQLEKCVLAGFNEVVNFIKRNKYLLKLNVREDKI